MPADALLLHHLSKELGSLVGGRIDKIYMPSYEDVVLVIKNYSVTKLLISCSSATPRCSIVSKTGENPDSPYGFLMHLRKHVSGGVVQAIEQIPYERVLKFTILSKNNMFTENTYYLYVELMGKFSNIILVNENGKISDSAKHLPLDVTTRSVLPGLEYKLPPPQIGKVEPSNIDTFLSVFKNYQGGNLASFIQSNFVGFAPASVKEAVFRSGVSKTDALSEGNVKSLFDAFSSLMTDFRPALKKDDGKYVGFYPSPYLSEQGEFEIFPTLCSAIEKYYEIYLDKTQISARGKKLQLIVKQHLSRCEKNEEIFAARLHECEDCEELRIYGELILANIYKIKQGMEKISVDNYYTGEQITIPLDKTIPPQQNANLYFKKYNKTKNSITATTRQMEENEQTKDYLGSLLQALENASAMSDYDDVEREMIQQRIIKTGKASKQSKPGKPIELQVDGFRVLIGKNNVQNDTLVKKSQRDYLWLHTQKIHGSHAIIEGRDIPQDTINKVAAYCAYYSQASASANVPVDYTLVKFVKKPTGAPPGKVIYTNQQTVNVTPKKP